MDTGIPLFFSEIEYLLLETIPLETIMRVTLILRCLTSHSFAVTLILTQFLTSNPFN